MPRFRDVCEDPDAGVHLAGFMKRNTAPGDRSAVLERHDIFRAFERAVQALDLSDEGACVGDLAGNPRQESRVVTGADDAVRYVPDFLECGVCVDDCLALPDQENAVRQAVEGALEQRGFDLTPFSPI